MTTATTGAPRLAQASILMQRGQSEPRASRAGAGDEGVRALVAPSWLQRWVRDRAAVPS
jgi:hypothetical protein